METPSPGLGVLAMPVPPLLRHGLTALATGAWGAETLYPCGFERTHRRLRCGFEKSLSTRNGLFPQLFSGFVRVLAIFRENRCFSGEIRGIGVTGPTGGTVGGLSIQGEKRPRPAGGGDERAVEGADERGGEAEAGHD